MEKNKYTIRAFDGLTMETIVCESYLQVIDKVRKLRAEKYEPIVVLNNIGIEIERHYINNPL